MIKDFKTSKGEFAFVKESNITEGTKKFYNFEVIGFTQALTEEQWKEVVDCSKKGSYFNYVKNKFYNKNWSKIFTALESAQTLMQSLELEGTDWILIKYL